MKTKNIFSFVVMLFICFVVNSQALAKEIKYKRSAAIAYAAEHTGDPTPYTVNNRYNFTDYKCWNGELLECENHPSKGGNGRKTDCANFASQALIAGGIDFSNFDFNQFKNTGLPVTPTNISTSGRKIGFPRVADLLPVINISYCFEVITDPYWMQRKAKEGDILKLLYDTKKGIQASHVMVYAGDNKFYAHTGDRKGANVPWNNVWLLHFQDDDPSKTCVQYDGTIFSKLLPVSTTSSSPTVRGPGGDHPDDNSSVGTGLATNEAMFNKNAPIGILDNGFPSDMQKVLSLFNREARLVSIDGVVPSLVAEMPLLIIPSGGLSGLSDSQFFKTALEEYVKNGGSVLMLSQQHGYEYSAIPGGIGGYGWTEDQNCQANSSYIDTWHQILSGQTNATPSLNVDGYFTSIPANATVLLRRTANGQPALITYPYGNGRIIATSVYTDFAYSFGQAGSEEISLIRDIVSWATKPEALQEIKPGESINQNLSITNGSDSITATAAWVEILAPDGKEIKSSFKVPLSLAPGQSIQIPISYSSSAADPPGIYHIKYSLFSERSILLTSEEEPDGVDTPVEFQLQAPSETDSGRFAVSNPPQTGTIKKDIWLSITSPNQEVFFNEPFLYTFHIFNNSPTTRNLTLKSWLPHTNRWHEWPVTATANGETVISGSDLFIDNYWMFETLRAYLYDENGVQIGSYMLSFKGVYPAVDVTTTTGNGTYTRGQAVNLSVNLKNSRSAATAAKLGVIVTDPSNLVAYAGSQDVSLAANGTLTQPFSFPLAATAQGGLYTVSTEVSDTSGKKIGGDTASFTIPLRFVTVAPTIPAVLNPGANTVSFGLSNLGTLPVSSGVLVASLIAPDGMALGPLSQPFTLDAGQSRTVDFSFSVPPLKFGSYTLSYMQSDETKAGKSATVTLPSSAVIAASFDKPSYRIRETANLALTLTNNGRFNLDGLSVTVSVPDAGYADTKTVNIGQGQALPLQYAISLPETIAAGQHPVTVTLTLPGGSAITKGFIITVPDSLLSYSLAQSSAIAGGTVPPAITNSGGKDTTAEYRLTLYDAKSSQIADQSATASVPAGGTLALNLPLPLGATDGVYTLVATYRNTVTGQAATVHNLLSVSGIKGALTLRSDKPSYLNTESIAGLSTITNSGTQLQGGNLYLQVTTAAGSQKQKTWTSQFDFQQGVRDGVDTYGVNDWVIPDDDFEGAAIDTDKWQTNGDVSIKSGRAMVNSSSVQAEMYSKWALKGDFDIQTDFSSNNSAANQGAEFTIQGPANSHWVFIKNTQSQGYISGVHINGNYLANRSVGSYASSGRLRIVKTGNTAVTYYWSGSTWVEVFRCTYPEIGDPSTTYMWVWRGSGYSGTSASFDNFKVNSGSIKTENQTVDSVRLLPLNDNFDDGIINQDRWNYSANGSGNIYEQNGKLYLENSIANQLMAVAADHKLLVSGDVDVKMDYSLANWQAQNSHKLGLALIVPAVQKYYLVERSYDTHFLGDSYFTDYLGLPITAVVPTSDISGTLRIGRTGTDVVGSYLLSNVWTVLQKAPVDPSEGYLHIGLWNDVGNPNPATKVFVNNFQILNKGTYAQLGTLKEKHDAGLSTKWSSVRWSSTEPVGTTVKFRTRTAASEAGLTSATWSDYLTSSGASITSLPGRWIEVEATLSTTDTNITPLLHDVTVTYGNSPGDILWQADVPVTLAQGALANLSNTISTLGAAGKYYLQGTLTTSTGQSVATAEYPFFVAQGNTLLSFTSDKRIYKPDETVTISGEVKNLATVEAANLNLGIKGKPAVGAEQSLYSATFTLPAGGSRPFTITTTAGAEGTVALIGTVTQNTSTLVQIADQYEVAVPKVTAVLTAPDTVGNDPFALTLTLANSGKTDATVTVLPSITSLPEAVTIPAGQTKLLQYSRQISADTTDTFTISGDLTQVITKTVKYGPAVALSAAAQAIYPEGKIVLPMNVTNSGLIDNQFTVNYQLTQGANSISQLTKSYFIPKGANSSDSLTFDLPEGSYQLAVTSQKPTASATASFQVRKESKAELALSVGAQSANLLPTTVTVANLGYNPIEGTVRVSLIDSNGATAWSAAQDVSLPQSLTPAPQTLAYAINLATLKPGSYTVKAELLDGGNRQLTSQSVPFTLLGPVFAITQLPQYRTIPSGGSSDFGFKIRNSGNQEGKFDLHFKADDLVDSVRSEWLKPGEEKELTFALQAASDLDEKDYFASYSLKPQGAGSEERGTVKYHLQGLNLAVTAALDRQTYNPGDTATFTLSVTQQDAGAMPNLFARVNYNGYNEKQEFTLNGSQTLTFTVPLAQITGEKLFYGIYTESGRSIHLNTMYVYKADGELALATEKQVYNPGETVTAIIAGSATGDLTLTGPGEFTTAFAYSGSDSKSFTLPTTMTAGTYTLKAQLTTQNSKLITASYPFDVTGIQVKVKEALLDKAKYAATDTMQLSLTIESNQDLASTVRTWIVDPAGSYTEAGSSAVTLSSAMPSLTTQNSQLTTASLGIHKLVYGIYQGDMLLASGAKAFDIGEAVLLGLATDKSDYPEITLPVNVNVDLYGTTVAGIELLLDGVSIKSDSVNLTGLGSYSFTIPPASVTPGVHVLKAVLTAGGLTSNRELRFTYASSLPDLTARIASQSSSDGTVNLSLTVNNQGKTAAGASRAALYDGDPANGGLLLTTLDLPSIAAGSSTTLPYAWNGLGKSGDHVLFAVADSDNSVVEFIEGNNTALTAVTLPSLSLAVTTGKSAYGANEAAAIIVSLANLTASLPLENSTLKLRLTSAAGTTIDLADKTVATMAPATLTTLSEVWNTGISEPSTYSISARLVSGTTELATATGSFTVVPTQSLIGSIAPAVAEVPQDTSLAALFTISNSGNIPVDGKLQGIIRDTQSGTNMAVQEIALQLPVSETKTGTFSFPVAGLSIKGYDLLLSFISATGEIVVAQSRFTIKDTIPPVLTVSTLSDGSYTNSTVLNITGTVSDNTGVRDLLVNSASVPFNVDGSFSLPLVLKPGDNLIEVKAIDLAENIAIDSRTITLDQHAPDLTIDTPADNSKTAVALLDVTGTVKETSTVQVKLGSNIQTAAMDGNKFSATVVLIPGPDNTIDITATDLANNSSSQKRTVVYDDRKPSLSITLPNQDIRTNQANLLLQGEASDPYTSVTVGIAMDGQNYTPPVIEGQFEQLLAFAAEKSYAIVVTATNEVKSTTTAQRNVIYDITKPPLSINPVTSPTSQKSQVISGTREADAPVVVSCAIATIGVLSYPSATTWTVEISNLQTGSNTITVTSRDMAGYASLPVSTVIMLTADNSVTAAGPAKLWIGLKNSDDQGTQFDLRAELYVNGLRIAEGETRCITGVTRNPSLAKEIAVPFNALSNGSYVSGDIVSLKLLTRVGTTATGLKCPGPGGSHNNAVGLRLYYDAPDRPSRISAAIAPEQMKDYFIHTVNGNAVIDAVIPTGAVKYMDSSGVDFNNGNQWKQIGAWTRVLL
jgi:hypothetical protein